VDKPVEGRDEDAALEAFLEKQADAEPEDFTELRQKEREVWEQFKQNPTKENFGWLADSHQRMRLKAQSQNLGSTTLPKSAVRSDGLRQYIVALQTWDPNKAAFSTHLTHKMQHNSRYLVKYQNIGKIPEDRAHMIGLFQNRLAHLKEQLGREPSNAELADDMKTSMAEVAELSKSMKKVTPRTIETLRSELRRDLHAESPGAETHTESSPLLERAIFLHGSLSPAQQVVLEHTFEGFGKPIITDPIELAPVVGMSPQKIRALKKQIASQLKRYW
jgi:DNA-directed RNA polymerase sigma subunit (sigma70/sigma32)